MLNIFSDAAIRAIIDEIEKRIGKSIKSVEQTTTSTEDGGENIITITLSSGDPVNICIKNGSIGPKGDPGATGPAGRDGACNVTYIASLETIKIS